MDDDYELVPKDLVNELKEENRKLKEELGRRDEAIRTLKSEPKKTDEQGKKERDEILAHLKEIKELNKSTLNNILSKDNEVENKISNLIDALNTLNHSLKELIEEVGKGSKDDEKIKELIERIDMQSLNFDKIDKNMDDMNAFLNNLKVLLSYVRPNDLTIEKR